MNFMKITAAAAVGVAMSMGGALAAYPEKPVKIVVGFSAGGGTDTTARGFASYMHEAPSMNGMPAVITNIPGASGQKGAKIVADGDKDGYTLYMINMGTLAAGELAKGDAAPFNAAEDFVVVGCMTQLVSSLMVHRNDPANTAQEWIDRIKSSGETVKWASSGATSMHSLIGTLMLDQMGIPHQPVPFNGGSKARAAIVSEKLKYGFNGVHIMAGFEDDIKVLAVAGAERDPANPDIPTFGEAGLGDVPITGPMCLFAPTGTPDDAIAALEAAVEDVAGKKGYAKYMKKNNLAAFHIPRAEAEVKMASMYTTFKPLVERALKN
jgi:tripartite-type tricarboxylate transporter receptor subunit TctC